MTPGPRGVRSARGARRACAGRSSRAPAAALRSVRGRHGARREGAHGCEGIRSDARDATAVARGRARALPARPHRPRLLPGRPRFRKKQGNACHDATATVPPVRLAAPRRAPPAGRPAKWLRRPRSRVRALPRLPVCPATPCRRGSSHASARGARARSVPVTRGHPLRNARAVIARYAAGLRWCNGRGARTPCKTRNRRHRHGA